MTTRQIKRIIIVKWELNGAINPFQILLQSLPWYKLKCCSFELSSQRNVLFPPKKGSRSIVFNADKNQKCFSILQCNTGEICHSIRLESCSFISYHHIYGVSEIKAVIPNSSGILEKTTLIFFSDWIWPFQWLLLP